MTKRPERGSALFYHRDSEGNSRLVPPQYVEWGQRESVRLGVTFSGTPAAISAMIESGRAVDGDLFIDFGISGNLLRRPGLDAFRARAINDSTVTHLLVPRRDRIARPANPNDGLEIERELRTAGLTLVFMDGMTLGPTPRGADLDLGEQIVGLVDYHNSGRFRRELAEKQVYSQIKLATLGFSIGGEPPYGFRRWLAAADGTPKRELEDHETVHLPGHHVIWRPTATEEMKVVLRILDLIVTIPAARIARMLNVEGIPSPNAGRVRARNGVKVETSGEWTQNTVRNVAVNPLLIAVWEYGRHSEGDQRRLTPTGPRALGEGDFHPDGKPKTVINSDDQIIRTPAKSEAVTTQENFDRIREVIEARGRHMRGKPRTRGQSPNPLGGRIYDMNCGWLMYRNAKRKKWCYGCGLYQNSQAKCCRHNLVEGEKASRFVLACLRQRLLNPSTLSKLKGRLQELATAEPGEDPGQRQVESDRIELVALRRKVEKVAENMALAESREERDATAAVFRKLKDQESALERRIASQRSASPQAEPQQQVEAALGTLERLTESITNGTVDWSVIGGAFNHTNAKLYLRFSEVEKGRTKINVPAGGVVTFGSTSPPGFLYTGPTDRPSIRKMLAAGESVTAIPECVTPGNSDSGQDVIRSANVQSRKRHIESRGGGGELREQPGHSRLRFHQFFRVPLHPNEVLRTNPFDTLDDAIRSECGRGQRRGQVLDRLMVHAVHRQHGIAQNLPQPRALLHRDVMRQELAARLLRRREVIVLQGRRHLRGDVLIQRAAAGHVQNLQPATHREHRQAAIEGVPQECDFHGIAIRVDGAAQWRLQLAIAGRVHIHAAGDEHAIKAIEDFLKCVVIVWDQRDEPGHAANLLHCFDVTAAHEPTRLPFAGEGRQGLRGNANNGARHLNSPDFQRLRCIFMVKER